MVTVVPLFGTLIGLLLKSKPIWFLCFFVFLFFCFMCFLGSPTCQHSANSYRCLYPQSSDGIFYLYNIQILGTIDQPILLKRWVGVQKRTTTVDALPIRTRPCEQLRKLCKSLIKYRTDIPKFSEYYITREIFHRRRVCAIDFCVRLLHQDFILRSLLLWECFLCVPIVLEADCLVTISFLVLIFPLLKGRLVCSHVSSH